MSCTNPAAIPDSEAMMTDALRDTIRRTGVRTAKAGAVLISKSGRFQNWLIDLRPVFMQRDALEAIAATFWRDKRGGKRFQLCAMETAGIPLLTALMLCAPKEMGNVNGFIIRKERKTTGVGNTIEGDVADDPIVFVDDIINSGSSVEKARAVLKSISKTIDEIFAVIDYKSRKGMHWRATHRIKVTSLFGLSDFDLALGKNPEPPPQQYRELWHASVPGGYPFYVVPKSAPLLIGNRLYRGCDAGKMQAFDADTGAVVWEYQATGAATRKGIWSCPAVHDGRLYFGAYNGCIYCLDASTGKEIWVQSYGEWVGASPVIVPEHGLVYFGIEYERPWAQGSIGAFDIRDGKKVWERRTKALQHGSPAYWKGGDLIIWGTADHDMVGLDARTGDMRWEFRTRRSVKYSPAVDEARRLVAFASFDKSIYILDAATGQKRGEWETGELCYTTPLFVGSKLFCGSGDRNLYVIDVDHMEIVRKIDLHARIYSSPVLVGERVIVGTAGGRVVEIDVKTLEIQGEVQVPDAVTNAIAVAEDGSRIFVSSYMNHIFAFERIQQTVDAQLAGTRSKDLSHEAAPLDGGRSFTRIAKDIDLSALRDEVLSQPEAWLVNTSRQRKIGVQRHTESIFLREAQRSANEADVPTEDIHLSRRTDLSDRFPVTMKWLEDFSRKAGRSVARALVAKLMPRAQVFKHVDGGAYYKIRGRYHLVLVSAVGSPMLCGDEEVVMREGEVWWFNNKMPHEAFNHSDADRIHLIFDLDP